MSAPEMKGLEGGDDAGRSLQLHECLKQVCRQVPNGLDINWFRPTARRLEAEEENRCTGEKTYH